jgi:predicted ATPase
LQWQKEDTVQAKTDKLQTILVRYRFPQADTLPLFAALLSLPQPADMPSLNLSLQRQKQKTEEALIAWLLEEAERAPLYCAWEDLHWADPSTLELLGKLIDQTPTTRLFMLLTSRPEFTPPWGQHGHFSQLTLSRLGRRQVPQMIEQATGGRQLPPEVVQQIVAKTDGVPLFVEELTKMVLESGLLTETDGHYELSGPLPPLAIPSTLQDSLMARLDRLASVRELAQLGATIGREFSYDLLHAVSPFDHQMLQYGLRQLVETELVYQRGAPPQASYLFKHALIQDTAYQSLLKSRRQQLHQQIAQILAERFPETKDTQPELLAHHYTEAGLIEQAIPYWQKAGQKAASRSANSEASRHLTKGIELLKTLQSTPALFQQELILQTTLGPVLMAVKGYAAPEVGQAYARARELCRQIGETPQLCPVLHGLWAFYVVRAEHRTAYEIGEQLLSLAESQQDNAGLIAGRWVLGCSSFLLGELTAARAHLEQGFALYNLKEHRSLAFVYGHDPGMSSLCFTILELWHLGYSDQALKRSQAAVSLAREIAHPYSVAYALTFAAWCYQLRREEQAVEEQAEAGIALSIEHGVPTFLAMGTIFRGWALAEHGQGEEGIAQICQGLATYRVIGAECLQPYFLALLAETYKKVSRTDEGLNAVSEALTLVNKTGERFYEAELYRLKGELTLQQQFKVQSLKSKVEDSSEFGVEDSPESRVQGPGSSETKSQLLNPNSYAEAEGYFLKAIKIAQRQRAKSLELRAVMSLVRLRQHQAQDHATRNTQHATCSTQHESRVKLAESHRMLSDIYHWFTEGFDTKDLQEAKALLGSLSP